MGQDGAMSDQTAFRWARRVQQELIRRLYALDAKGVQDEELVNEAGYALYARCESIRIATEAHFGRATCKRCRAVIERHNWPKNETLVCADCGWQTTWAEYHKSYQRKQLVGGAAYPSFLEFLERWPNARAYRDKLLAIDRLIHALHIDAKLRSFRPAAVNVIECDMREAQQLLQELAYGAQSTPGVEETRAEWEATVATIGETMRANWSKRALERRGYSGPGRGEERGG
jgi:hypothetical protein